MQDTIEQDPWTIPCEEAEFNPHSTQDPAGRVFRWGESIYRGITREYTPLFNRVFADGTIDRLSSRGLIVESERTRHRLPPYELVLKHRRLPFVSHPIEWCPQMLKDAALVTLELNIELARAGLTLRDAHPWNILFDGPNARHVDLTSIMPFKGDGEWSVENEFYNYFMFPLLLMSAGRHGLAQSLMYSDELIRRSDILRLLPFKTGAWITLGRSRQWLANRFMHSRRPGAASERLARRLEQLRAAVQSIKLPVATPAVSELSPVQKRSLAKVLEAPGTNSVLLIEPGDEACAWVTAAAPATVVSLDLLTETAQLHAWSKSSGVPVLPLAIDFLKITAAFGRFSMPAGDAASRLRCSVVVAPHLGERLHGETNLAAWDYALRALALFAEKAVVFQVGSELELISSALERIFPSIQVVQLENGRRLVVCRK
jgi:hypothetical protein